MSSVAVFHTQFDAEKLEDLDGQRAQSVGVALERVEATLHADHRQRAERTKDQIALVAENYKPAKLNYINN